MSSHRDVARDCMKLNPSFRFHDDGKTIGFSYYVGKVRRSWSLRRVPRAHVERQHAERVLIRQNMQAAFRELRMLALDPTDCDSMIAIALEDPIIRAAAERNRMARTS